MNMVERVARAMHEIPGEGYEWDHASEEARNHAREYARVVIKAMREPTEAMVLAGHRKGVGFASAGNRMCNSYRAMIDQALTETE